MVCSSGASDRQRFTTPRLRGTEEDFSYDDCAPGFLSRNVRDWAAWHRSGRRRRRHLARNPINPILAIVPFQNETFRQRPNVGRVGGRASRNQAEVTPAIVGSSFLRSLRHERLRGRRVSECRRGSRDDEIPNPSVPRRLGVFSYNPRSGHHQGSSGGCRKCDRGVHL
jgi:hypothetical protein